jgi:hypothetical protein
MTEEEAGRKKASEADQPVSAVDGTGTSLEAVRSSSHSDRLPRSPVEKTMEKAQRQAERSERRGANEQAMPERTLGVTRSPSAERSHGQAGSTLPVVEEAGEAGSTGGKSGNSVGGTAVDEKERGRPRDEESHAGIRRVISAAETPTTEKADGLLNAPELPPLSTTPMTMDPVKSLVDDSEKPGEFGLQHAR